MFEVTSLSDLSDHLSSARSAEVRAASPSDDDLQRARGSARIVLSGSEKGARIIDVFQRSPVRIMFPRSGAGAVEEAVLVNTSGGIAGGDHLEYTVTALPGASLALTSQAAEKVYRALSVQAQISTKLNAHEDAKLAWLPQETIIFNGARLNRRMEIVISSGSEVLALEWLVIGRAASGEKVIGGDIRDTWRIRKDGRLIWADSFRISDDIFSQLHRKALLSNYKAIAMLIYYGSSLASRLELLRETAASLQCQCAATQVGGVIVVRLAAETSSDLRHALRDLLRQFERERGPGPFRVPKMWEC